MTVYIHLPDVVDDDEAASKTTHIRKMELQRVVRFTSNSRRDFHPTVALSLYEKLYPMERLYLIV